MIFLFYSLHLALVINSYLINSDDFYIGYFFIPYAFFCIFWLVFKNIKDIGFIHLVVTGMFYLGSPPVFENDQYRYLWEGKVVASGNNPYIEAPSSDNLDHINFLERKNIAHNKLTTIYPPLAQAYFLMFSPFTYSVGLLLMQLSSFVLLMFFLYNQFYNKFSSIVLITPFLYKEFIQSVHLDLLAMFLLWFLWRRKRHYSSIVFSFLVKILGILIFPFLIINEYFQGKVSKFGVLLSTVVFLIIALIYQYGHSSTQVAGTEAFVKFWFWNSLLGKPLYLLGVPEKTLRFALIGSFFISYIGHLILQFNQKGRKTQLIVANCFLCLYLFSPVLHSWYLIWPLVFIPNNSRYHVFLFVSVLSYSSYIGSFFEGYSELIQLLVLVWVIAGNLISITKEDKAF